MRQTGSVVGVGAGSWGSTEEEARAMVDMFTERGGTFIDTADFYGPDGRIGGVAGQYRQGTARALGDLVRSGEVLYTGLSDVPAWQASRMQAIAEVMNDPIGQSRRELIQPVSGPTEIYTDEVDLSAHIINYHHIATGIPGPYSEWERLLADVQASGDGLAYLFPAVPDPASKLCFSYVDTRKRIGHYTEYLWADPALAGIAAAPWLEG